MLAIEYPSTNGHCHQATDSTTPCSTDCLQISHAARRRAPDTTHPFLKDGTKSPKRAEKSHFFVSSPAIDPLFNIPPDPGTSTPVEHHRPRNTSLPCRRRTY